MSKTPPVKDIPWFLATLSVCIGTALLLVLFATAVPGLARAAACSNTTQAALGMCAEAHRVAADKRLNEAYRRVVARLEGPDDQRQRSAFKDAESVWIKFRDSECQFESAGSYGGSMNSMALADCATKLSDARATTLEGMATCHSREGSCVLGP